MGKRCQLTATLLSAIFAAGSFAQGPRRRAGPAISQEALKKQPQTPRATGDHERHYFFAPANVETPYRLYVPKSWDGKQKLPLVVVLHGASGDHNQPFDNTATDAPEIKGILQRQAEKHGFIVASPEGYKRTPWGNALPRPIPPGQTREESQRYNRLSEQDVLNVVAVVSKEYGTDPARLYLMGNSMGSTGALSIAASYPAMWAAISASDGGALRPSLFDFSKLKGIPGARVLQGENDDAVSMESMKAIADKIKEQGVDTEFFVVPGGTHRTAWYIALPATFDFFARHVRRANIL